MYVVANGVSIGRPLRHSRRQELLVTTAVVLLLYPYTTTLNQEILSVNLCGDRRTNIDFEFHDPDVAKDVLRCQQTLRLFKEACESRNVKLPRTHGVDTMMLYNALGISYPNKKVDEVLGLIFTAFAFLQFDGAGHNYALRV